MSNHSLVPITVQLRIAAQKGNRLATAIGAILGTVVPVMVYAVTHKLPSLGFTEPAFYVLFIMAIGGCYFSMKSVIVWGKLAFQGDSIKAVAFALLLEGMLVMSGMLPDMAWLGYASLAYLCLINAISAGCSIALEAKTYNREQAATMPRKPVKKMK
jgi:protein-S-isoprenylcysteine O-methyltransferase Ste14